MQHYIVLFPLVASDRTGSTGALAYKGSALIIRGLTGTRMI